MSYVNERLHHITAADDTIHVAFPTALLTLCGDHDPTDCAESITPSECERCLANMHSLIDVAPSVAPRGHVAPKREQTRTARSNHAPRSLTPRELQTIKLVAEGLTDRAVAERLNISLATATQHVKRSISKLGASNRTHAVAIAYRTGQIELGRAAA